MKTIRQKKSMCFQAECLVQGTGTSKKKAQMLFVLRGLYGLKDGKERRLLNGLDKDK